MFVVVQQTGRQVVTLETRVRFPTVDPKERSQTIGNASENIDNSSAKIKILGFCVTKTLEIGCVAEWYCT
jgi:hypothetical protein